MIIDLSRVEEWMDDRGLGRGPIGSVAPISGGTQNVMLRFVRDGRPYVLRRGPEHLRPRSNDVIRRECRVLRSLSGTAVPHPALVAACEDESVLGDAVFYLMEPVDGFNASIALPPLHEGDAATRHEMGLRLVDALATLAELASYDEIPEYPGPDIGPVDEVAAWLETHRPADRRPGILHGDYHAANVMFSPHGPDVVAVVDWEMCTIGDPLLDLGWLLATWQLPGAPEEFAGPLTRAGGLATTDELVQRYAERTTRDLSALDWYVVLACFKLGIILEGSHARALAGLAPKDIGDRLHVTTLRLFERAHELIQHN